MDSKWYSEERGIAAPHEEHTEAEPCIVYRRFMPVAISSLILKPCSVNINAGEADNPAGCPGHFPLGKQCLRCKQTFPNRGQRPFVPVLVEKQILVGKGQLSCLVIPAPPSSGSVKCVRFTGSDSLLEPVVLVRDFERAI